MPLTDRESSVRLAGPRALPRTPGERAGRDELRRPAVHPAAAPCMMPGEGEPRRAVGRRGDRTRAAHTTDEDIGYHA